MQILSFQADIAERMLEGTEGESVNENAQFVRTDNGYWIAWHEGVAALLAPDTPPGIPCFWWKGRKALKSCARWWNAASLTKWKSLTAMTTRGSKRLKIADTTATLAPADIKGMAGLPQGCKALPFFK